MEAKEILAFRLELRSVIRGRLGDNDKTEGKRPGFRETQKA